MADKVKVTLAGPGAGEKFRSKNPGDEVTVDVDEARGLVDAGWATYATRSAEEAVEGKK